MSKASTKSFKERALSKHGPKQKVNSKVKGNKNELEVAKALSKWTGVEFRRTPMSGAIHVPLDWLAGDVFCTDKHFNFPFSVEAKHYHKLTNKMKTDFWIQTCNDADRIKKKPFLMYREDGWPAGTWMVRLSFGWDRGLLWGMPEDGLGGVLMKSEELFNIPYDKFLSLI